MDKTENMSLIQKLIAIRKEFSAARLNKTGKNKFAGYDYFQLEDIIPTAIELCTKYGIYPQISFNAELAVMTVYDADSPQTLTITSPMASAELKGCHDIQNMGAVETYSRRYLWMALFEIVEADALDMTQGAPNNQPQRQSARQNTVAPQNAPQKDTRPAKAPHNTSRAWNEACKFYGYDTSLPPSAEKNVKAKEKAKKFMAPYATRLEDLTEEKAEAMLARIAVMRENAAQEAQKGPEDFSDDSAEFGVGA